MKNSDMVRIAVATSHSILRTGTVTVLRRILETNVTTQEISRPEDFATRIRSFAPTILVLDPGFAATLTPATLRQRSDLALQNVKMVALVSGLISTKTGMEYDAQLNIYDDDDTMRQLFDSLTHNDEPASEPTETEEPLSAREKQVVKGVVCGLTNKEIAEEMNISVYTVLTHRRNIARKLQIHSSIALAIYAISNKITTVDEVK